MHHEIVHYSCRWTDNKVARLGFFFEGDDSLLFLSRKLKTKKAAIEALWSRFGFNMKLKFIVQSADEDGKEIDGPAEFCGWHYLISKGGVAGSPEAPVCTPDLRRALKNSVTNCRDATLKKEFRDQVARDAATARAACIAGSSCLANEYFGRASSTGRTRLRNVSLMRKRRVITRTLPGIPNC